MSDGIQTRSFDGQMFGHSWSSRRIGDLPGAYGPPDPSPEDEAAYERECEERRLRETNQCRSTR